MKTLTSAGDLVALRNRIALVNPADTRLWGSMNAHQMICHLADALRCPLGERNGGTASIHSTPTPDLQMAGTSLPQEMASRCSHHAGD
jgi:hypothetical protein